jgi:phytoene synthase
MKDLKKIVRSKIKNGSGRTVFWGMQFLPKAKREALYTLLAFVRHLEDVVESPVALAEKQEILSMWREEMDNIFERRVPATDIGRRIYKNCMRFKLPKAEFLNLVDSISANIDNPLKAPTLKQLSGYCRGVGGMTGSLSLRVFGCTDEQTIRELSTSLGLAVQITNILLNVKEDAQNDRLYIPQELLEKAGISATDPKSVVVDKNLAAARRELARIAAENYRKVYEILEKQEKTTARPIRLITDLYRKYFDIMEKRGWEIISPKPRVSKWCKLRILLKNLLSA